MPTTSGGSPQPEEGTMQSLHMTSTMQGLGSVTGWTGPSGRSASPTDVAASKKESQQGVTWRGSLTLFCLMCWGTHSRSLSSSPRLMKGTTKSPSLLIAFFLQRSYLTPFRSKSINFNSFSIFFYFCLFWKEEGKKRKKRKDGSSGHQNKHRRRRASSLLLLLSLSSFLLS